MDDFLRNAGKARDRLRLALYDLRRGLARFSEGDYPDSLFRVQLAVENGCKAVLSYLGVEYGPTHFPSVLLGRILSERESVKRLNLAKEQIEVLIRIASNASALEVHGAMPRYGWEVADRIIMPGEIYDQKASDGALRLGINTFSFIIKFFEGLQVPEDLASTLQELREEIKRVPQ